MHEQMQLSPYALPIGVNKLRARAEAPYYPYVTTEVVLEVSLPIHALIRADIRHLECHLLEIIITLDFKLSLLLAWRHHLLAVCLPLRIRLQNYSPLYLAPTSAPDTARWPIPPSAPDNKMRKLASHALMHGSEEHHLGAASLMLYMIAPAMQPRMLVTLDEDLKPLPVSVRVGQLLYMLSVLFLLLEANPASSCQSVL